MPTAKAGSQGVTHTQLAVEDELRWLFREQPTEDYGIDAHVEIVDEDEVLGRLLALQIKSGASFFREATPDGWWFRPDAEHVQYWLNHSLPVVVVLYKPETKVCYWQFVSRETLQRSSRGGWKLLVPQEQVLNGNSAQALRAAADADPYVLRIRDLQLARPWMERLAAGARLVIDIEEWVNKISGRGEIVLGVDNEDGQSPTELARWPIMLGLSSYADVVPGLFAWAKVDLHEETYDNADWDQYDNECRIWDSEMTFYSEEYSEWRERRLPGLRPYTDDGEVAFWRLELTLNELGTSFLVVDQFGATGKRQLVE
ncbi:DUF4365 domain-containing protein [Kitasatospora sp. NPDC002965]|uniref:DUF4365 domain-containing protein n=1 Tax=Kitasatospora sp. NPDC002965 TaxID=3154775 RepID=UPI0033B5919E